MRHFDVVIEFEFEGDDLESFFLAVEAESEAEAVKKARRIARAEILDEGSYIVAAYVSSD